MEQTSVSTRIRQLTSLAGFITSVLAGLSFEAVQYWLKHKTLLRAKLVEAFDIPVETYADFRIEWQKFYKDHFKMVVDFSEVIIPEKPSEGRWRLLFIPAGLTLNTIIAIMRTKFKVTLYGYGEDLNTAVPTNTRITVSSYAVWVRDGVEPDEKYLGKSTREADLDGKIGMTLLEWFVFELKFFLETGEHLDFKGVPICTGSRYSDGNVPRVDWSADSSEVCVSWCRLVSSYPTYGLRQAGSL